MCDSVFWSARERTKLQEKDPESALPTGRAGAPCACACAPQPNPSLSRQAGLRGMTPSLFGQVVSVVSARAMKEASLETPLKADLADDLLRFRRQVERECLINQVWSVATLVISTVLYLAVGVVFYSNFESWDVGDSLYFCIVTLGTVGFGGDGLEPSEPGTRLFTIFYIYVGILLILSRAGTLVDKIATGTRVKLNAIAEHEALSSGAIKGGRIRRGSSCLLYTSPSPRDS